MLAYLLKGSLGELLAPTTAKSPQRRFLVRPVGYGETLLIAARWSSDV